MPREWAEPQLVRMLESLRHESFYEFGKLIDERSGVYGGWTTQANFFSDGMPFENETGDTVLLFSGEEYCDPSAVLRLKERGHQLTGEGPSHLVHLYEDDPTFPKALNGRFHGLIIEKSQGIAKLFNDRYSMHRLYYHESKEAFYFAVEAKAILAVRPELRRVDPGSMGELVSLGCVLENRTLFEGIQLLPPASVWNFRQGSLEKKGTYFQPSEWEQESSLEPEAYHDKILEVFSRNLPRYFKGREQIGMSLTGGLDTRVVMAWQKCPPGSLPTYTYGGALRECRDVTVARQVAGVCQQSHQVISVDSDFLSRFSHYAERAIYLSDGCVDVTRGADLYLSEMARRIAPVRMTGLYGDEVLRHLRAFKPANPIPGIFSSSFLPQVSAARETYSRILQCHPTSFAVFRQAPWHHHGILSLEETQLSVRTPFLDNDFVRTVFQAPASATANNDLRVRLIGDGNPALRAIRTDRGFAGPGGRVSGWFARSLLEFGFKAEYAYDYGMPQWLARIDHSLSAFHLERLFLGRHKLYHFRMWYRDFLAKYVKEILLDNRTLTRPYLKRQGVEAIVTGHLKGNRNYTSEIHRLLSLELIHRLFVDHAAFSTTAV